MTGPHHMPLDRLLPRIEEAARMLVDARCEVVAFHCTATSMEEGMAGEERVLAAVRRAGARHAVSTATAIRRALNALGARRIVLVTPYSAKTTKEEAEFLRSAGHEVVQAKGYDLGGSDAYCATPAEFWRERVIEAAHPAANAYFLSCANISTFGVIEAIEQALDRPLITSNQAVLWDALCRLDQSGRGVCPGRLFRYASEPVPA